MLMHTLTPYETWLLFKEIVIIIIGFLLLLPFSPYVYIQKCYQATSLHEKYLLQKEKFLCL